MKYINENYNTIEVSEGGWRGWARFNKTTGKELERRSNKTRKAEKNKAIQVRRFGDIEVAPDAVRAQEEYPPGAEADMNKLYKHKPYSAKDMDAMYKDYKKGQAEKRNKAKLRKVNMVGQSSQHNEGTYMGTFDKKAVDKYMSKKKKVKPASDEYKRKLAKAYGIRKEAMDDIKKRLQDKSNRNKDAEMVKKMQKVAFAHLLPQESIDQTY